ncbi:MAG: rhodanese-like domain-containing protein [Bacteroidetes bacterium]|nr:rhodanese-like domain-containing protein [Bacteroidota bacterium]
MSLWSFFRSSAPYKEVSPQEAHERMQRGAVLVDVRESEELREDGSVPGAVHNPLSTFDPERLPRDREAEVLFLCRSGNRSALVAEAVAQQLGYQNVYNVRGGILAWRRAGLPLRNGQ